MFFRGAAHPGAQHGVGCGLARDSKPGGLPEVGNREADSVRTCYAEGWPAGRGRRAAPWREVTISGLRDPGGLRAAGPRPETVRLAVTGAIDLSNASRLQAAVQGRLTPGTLPPSGCT
jgi:hypothetical protein